MSSHLRPHKHHGVHRRVTCAGAYTPCNLQLQIDPSGFVTVVRPGSPNPRLQEISGESFRVRWDRGAFPTADVGCAQGCQIRNQRCLCNMAVTSAPVFSDPASLPSLPQALERLRIGSPHPGMYDAAAYSRLPGESNDVQVHVRAGTASGARLSETAIFGLRVNGSSSLHYLFNKQSTVNIGGGGATPPISFRNAPHFVSLLTSNATVRDLTPAQYHMQATHISGAIALLHPLPLALNYGGMLSKDAAATTFTLPGALFYCPPPTAASRSLSLPLHPLERPPLHRP